MNGTREGLPPCNCYFAVIISGLAVDANYFSQIAQLRRLLKEREEMRYTSALAQ